MGYKEVYAEWQADPEALMGMGNRAHIVTPSITARGLLNMAAIAGTPVAHYG